MDTQLKIRMLLLATGVIFLLAVPTQAHFESGTIRFGAGLGVRASSEDTVFSFWGSGGAFVLKGLDIGASVLVQSGGNSPTLLILTGDVRFIPLPDLSMTPYLKLSGGGVFIEAQSDAWILAPGGGLLYMVGPWYGIDLEVAYRWLFFPQGDPEGDYTIRMGLMLLF